MDVDNTTYSGELYEAMNESDCSDVYNETSQYTYGARVFVATTVMIISLLGIAGNALVLISVALSNKLQTVTNVFVANLSIADLLMSLCGFINAVIVLIRGGLPASLQNLCILVAFMSPSMAGVIMFSIASIAVNRMLLIIKHATVYRVMYKPRRLIAMVTLLWLIPFLLTTILLATGTGRLSYNHRIHVCLDDSEQSSHYKTILAAILFPIPLILTLVCYAIVYVFLRRHFKKEKEARCSFHKRASTTTTSLETSFVDIGINTSSDVLRKKRIHKHQVQITKNLFIVSCVCFLLPLPNMTFIILGRDDLFLYGVIFLFANSAVNPVLYGAKHPMFKEVMLCILHRKWSAIPEPSRILKALLRRS